MVDESVILHSFKGSLLVATVAAIGQGGLAYSLVLEKPLAQTKKAHQEAPEPFKSNNREKPCRLFKKRANVQQLQNLPRLMPLKYHRRGLRRQRLMGQSCISDTLPTPYFNPTPYFKKPRDTFAPLFECAPHHLSSPLYKHHLEKRQHTRLSFAHLNPSPKNHRLSRRRF